MDTIALRGLIATTPRHIVTPEGRKITSFRFATNAGDHPSGGQYSNWYTVNAFDTLAIHASEALSKGDRVIVLGELRIRDWDNGERSGTSVEITASTIGHDLEAGRLEGVARFVRVFEAVPFRNPGEVD
jgi:single-strand DNA-binding protein